MPSYYQQNVTADSSPDYDSWGPDYYWDSSTWIQWHAALKAAKGQDQANAIFLSAYQEASMFAASYDWRTFDSTFIQYAKDEGFYDGLFVGILGFVAKPISVVGSGVSTGVNIVSKTIMVIETAFPYLLALVFVVIVFRLYQFARAR